MKAATAQQHGNAGNSNAAKENPASSFLHIRCTPEQKAAWVKASKGDKLAGWVKETLDKAAARRR